MILPKQLDDFIKRFLEAKGYVLSRGDDTRARERRRLILEGSSTKPIDLLLDVGANVGQYATTMRELGYLGKIVSFEPMKDAYTQLERAAEPDARWRTMNYGLGAIDSRRVLNISRNSVSSSLLSMLPSHLTAAPRSEYITCEEIDIKRLDDVFDEFALDAKSVWLKLDVQGFEDQVLAGAEKALSKIDFIQIELSLKPLYSQQKTYLQMCEYIEDRHFDLVGIEPGFMDSASGHLLQMDGIFIRRNR